MNELYSEDYSDIIHLPHHVSQRHPQMPIASRAAQFAPFAALTGYEAVIKETSRLTDDFIELGDHDSERLNRIVTNLMARIDEHPTITVTFFKPDLRKAGGSYAALTGRLKRLDEIHQLLIMEDDTAIPFSLIYDIR